MSGIYIHIPFCKKACNYCNFHFTTSLLKKDAVIAAIIKEINLTIPFTNNDTITTVYFGGGTPSILNGSDLQIIIAALQKKFLFIQDIEITIEANPDDITKEKLSYWQSIGINRLSVGIQSFLDEELIWMNRAHTAAESLICIDKIRDSGFDNFSIDLIYGSPLLITANWEKNIELILQKNVPHVSCYALTVEPKTPLNKMILQNKKQNIDAEKQATQFLLLMQWMQSAGYQHYEISNFSKPNFRSKHNSSYWSGDSYYGFGPAAHSFDGKSRKWNVSNNLIYINSLQKNIIPFEAELLTPIQQLNEYIMISIRTMEGLDLDYLDKKFGATFLQKIILKSKKWVDAKKIEFIKNKLTLTNQGKLFADGIAADLFF